MPDLYFEDFAIGQMLTFGDTLVTEEAIRSFAGEFDPQDFHLDDAAAQATPLRGLAASGWHTAAMGMRMIYDAVLIRAASMGAPGVEEVRWLAPVRPGDRLHIESRVASVRVSKSRPDIGLVWFEFSMLNQSGTCVMTQRNAVMFGRRLIDANP